MEEKSIKSEERKERDKERDHAKVPMLYDPPPPSTHPIRMRMVGGVMPQKSSGGLAVHVIEKQSLKISSTLHVCNETSL